MIRALAPLTVWTLLIASAGCSDEPAPPGADPVVRDSAGVTLVEAPVPEHGPADGWEVEEEPFLSIGEMDAEEEAYLFSDLQWAVLLPDGRIKVPDRGSHEVRLFDQEGTFLQSFGGPGQGPGEFSLAPAKTYAYRGDSIAVVEATGRTIHIFGSDGEFGRTITPEFRYQRSQGAVPRQSCCVIHEPLPDGRWVAQYPEEGPVDGSGVRRGSFELLLLSAEGEHLGRLGTFPGGLWRDAPSEHPSPITRVTLSGTPQVSIRDDRILLGNGEDFRVDEWDGEGTWVRSIRIDREPPAFDQDARRAYERGMREAAAEAESTGHSAELMRAGFDVLPDHLPAYSRILTDPDGRMWLLAATVPRVHPTPRHALVLDPEATVLGQVDLPEGLHPVQIGDDEILGITRDELDVPRVVLHRIVRDR